ncbi:Protease 2 [Pantoea agglomerans]|uniref:Protease 2 n=1 Tax=Enterobacter agglomerans TaxID=549 RepID=A0A379AES2_ENTAG|nr:Protease 2 [Pantoea agglomerans]
MKAPIAKKIPHEMTLHGETRVDDYYWLRDDKRENSEVLDYLRAENNYGKKNHVVTTATAGPGIKRDYRSAAA